MEFSRALVALFPWGAVGQACQAILNAKLVEVESNAATNEARIVKYGPKSTRNRNAIDASLIEFGRLQKEVFSPDSASFEPKHCEFGVVGLQSKSKK